MTIITGMSILILIFTICLCVATIRLNRRTRKILQQIQREQR